MLTLYQEAVRSLLSQSDYPGVSAEELELFKNQFRTSAFTCRLNSCPRATLGFESEKLRLEHEMAHARRFRCTFPGCKYPPFVSAQSLTNHLNKYHNPNPPRKSIRQVGHIPTTRSGNAAPTNVAMEGSGAVQNGQPSAAPPQLASLIRPEQVKRLPFLVQETKARQEVEIQKLWDIINTRPANSPEQQQAYSRLGEISAELRQWNAQIQQEAQQQMDATLTKKREDHKRIVTLYERSQDPDFRKRPLYADVRETMMTLEDLDNKPQGTIDLERELRRHEDWMRKGKKLFGMANAPLHILEVHMKFVEDKNNFCFDLNDAFRPPAEPSSREISPNGDVEKGGTLGEDEKPLFCICRRYENGMMIMCENCREW